MVNMLAGALLNRLEETLCDSHSNHCSPRGPKFIFEFNDLSTPAPGSDPQHSAKSEVNSWSISGSQARFIKHKGIDSKGSSKSHA